MLQIICTKTVLKLNFEQIFKFKQIVYIIPARGNLTVSATMTSRTVTVRSIRIKRADSTVEAWIRSTGVNFTTISSSIVWAITVITSVIYFASTSHTWGVALLGLAFFTRVALRAVA